MHSQRGGSGEMSCSTKVESGPKQEAVYVIHCPCLSPSGSLARVHALLGNWEVGKRTEYLG